MPGSDKMSEKLLFSQLLFETKKNGTLVSTFGAFEISLKILRTSKNI